MKRGLYSLVRVMPLGRLLREQVPALARSFAIAELLYKFHGFTLETLAFLATSGVIDTMIQVGRHPIRGPRATADDGSSF